MKKIYINTTTVCYNILTNLSCMEVWICRWVEGGMGDGGEILCELGGVLEGRVDAGEVERR